MAGSAGIIASIAKALSAMRPASSAVISRVPGRFTPSLNADSNMGARVLADCEKACNISRPERGTMTALTVRRRDMLAGAGALAAAMTVPWARVLAQAVEQLQPIPSPPPITAAERIRRLAAAKDKMRALGIGAVLVESGPSLDYFTGVQWFRSERLTAVVIPAEGDPIVVTPFFESP